MHKTKKILIIGAGMGGMAAGIYGRLHGYDTEIFEMHSLPGGQCTAYKRKGFIFDVCIHHLFGCAPGSKLYDLWSDLGVMPRKIILPEECTSVRSPDGTIFRDFYDLDKLQNHMLDLSNEDKKIIAGYIKDSKRVSKRDFTNAMIFDGIPGLFRNLGALLPLIPKFTMTLEKYGKKFRSPFLRRAFGKLVYSLSDVPLIVHLARKGKGLTGDIGWPAGGSLSFAGSMENRFRDLGGEIHYRSKVTEILIENDRAIGVKLEDGSEIRGDTIISDADGRKTIKELLGGKYTTPEIEAWCKPPEDEFNWAVHVFLGVDRDLSNEPSAMVLLLDQPEIIAGTEHSSVEIQMYGHDPSMAPPGKGVIKAELYSRYSYWKELSEDPDRYKQEKERITEQILSILEPAFPGISSQVEAVDVPTPLTWERYMGGTRGFNNMPNRKFSILGSMTPSGMQTTLPGLKGFYFTGVWATMAGALFINALSGKRVIEEICRSS